MQAIQVRTLPYTNTRPARVKAWASAGSVTLSAHAVPANVSPHGFAAAKLCAKLGWTGSLLSGSLPNSDSCFVFDVPTSRE